MVSPTTADTPVPSVSSTEDPKMTNDDGPNYEAQEKKVFDPNDALMAAMEDVEKSAGISIHGKQYKQVASRVLAFRKHFGVHARLSISECKEDETGRISMVAVVELATPEGWDIVAEGRAEEVRGSSAITKTSAMEVCETSAYGRALANLGLHGGEFASANEVENAVAQQGHKASPRDGMDLTGVDTALAQQYAMNIRKALVTANTDEVKALHEKLKSQYELYVVVGDNLTSKERADLRKIVSKEAA